MRALHGEKVEVWSSESPELADALAETSLFIAERRHLNDVPGFVEFYRIHQTLDDEGYTILVSVILA